MRIKESVYGVWSYHLAEDNAYKSFCGKVVMNTEFPIKAWGVKTDHINEKYCKKCYKIAKEKGYIK